jgi:hypothetical protein
MDRRDLSYKIASLEAKWSLEARQIVRRMCRVLVRQMNSAEPLEMFPARWTTDWRQRQEFGAKAISGGAADSGYHVRLPELMMVVFQVACRSVFLSLLL